MPPMSHRPLTQAGSPERLRTAVASISGRTIVAAGGKLDVVGCQRLTETFAWVIAQDQRDVVVDLSRVDLLDAAGLGSIVRASKSLREVGRELTVRLPSWTARQALEMCGLGSLIEDPSRVTRAQSQGQAGLA